MEFFRIPGTVMKLVQNAIRSKKKKQNCVCILMETFIRERVQRRNIGYVIKYIYICIYFLKKIHNATSVRA